MILSEQDEFSADQAIVATAESTNKIDLVVARNIAPGMPVPLLIKITEAFNTLTSLKIDVREDDNVGMASPTILASQTVLLAGLTLGAEIAIPFMPNNSEGFLDLNYTVTGTDPTTGKINAGFIVDRQTNRANV